MTRGIAGGMTRLNSRHTLLDFPSMQILYCDFSLTGRSLVTLGNSYSYIHCFKSQNKRVMHTGARVWKLTTFKELRF